MEKWKLYGGMLAAYLLVATGCGQGPAQHANQAVRTVAARVETLATEQLPMVAVVPGTLVAAKRVEISSRLSGYIYDLDVHEGQRIKKGQLLFAVDPTQVKEQIRQAAAEQAKAQAAWAEARDNYQRYRNLYQEASAATVDYQEAERNYKVAQGNLQAAKAALKAVRSQLKYSEVRAPFDGLIVSKFADNGQLSSPGKPVLVIESPDHLQVQIQVDEQAFSHLSLGQSIHIAVETEDLTTEDVTGNVERMVAAADPVTHTHLVKLGLSSGRGLWSGKFALVSIPVGEQTGIVVPEAAIHYRAGITGVFVVDAKDHAQFRMITLGEKLPQGRVVLSGLFAGDRLILSPGEELANGVKIQDLAESRP